MPSAFLNAASADFAARTSSLRGSVPASAMAMNADAASSHRSLCAGPRDAAAVVHLRSAAITAGSVDVDGVCPYFGAATATPRSWEFAALYQKIEKDALFGQLLDSDFADGNTDGDGFVIRGGYTVARNWTINAALFLNNLSNDVPQSVTVFDESTATPYDTLVINGINDREYKRLQLDLNFRF